MKQWVLISAITLANCGNEIDHAAIHSAPQPTENLPADTAAAAPFATSSGYHFRVWAPNADKVVVAGAFNNWSKSAAPMKRGNDGYYSGTVTGVKAGDNYQYLISYNGTVTTKTDPRALDVEHSTGAAIIVDHKAYKWKTTSFRMPTWDELVIYEMHIGTFHDQPGGKPGTFKSAIAKLDHLKKLGINAIELMPPAEFSGDFSWGYNPAFLFAPESAYGSPNDMKQFIDAAHQRGIAVIIDVVHNHYGPSDLSMWCFDGPCFGSGNGGIYFYTDWRKESGWGPRPDYGRVEVRDFIVDNAMLWLDTYRADGLRWDSTVNIRAANNNEIPEGWQLLQRINHEVNQRFAHKIQIAEDLQSNAWITKSTDDNGAGFDSQWDASFFHPINRNIIEQEDANRDMNEVKSALENRYNGQALQRVVYTESHDEVANGKQRIPEMIWPGQPDSYFSKKRSTLGAALVMTAPGIPMLFQGQEFLEDGYFRDDDPLDWGKAKKFSGIVALYRDLIRLRRNWDGNSAGLRGEHINVYHVNNTDKLISFHRWQKGGAGDDVIIVANFSDKTRTNYRIGFPRAGEWQVRLNTDADVYDSDFENTPATNITTNNEPYDQLKYSAAITVAPYAVIILSQ